MAGIAYVEGRYLPQAHARVHMEDRGYQFADGVYEVVAVHAGRLIDDEGHLARLERSLGELGIDMPMSRKALDTVLREVIRRNGLRFGSLYLQVTRGAAPRDHVYQDGMKPVVTITAKRIAPPTRAASLRGYTVISIPDIRWARCDIKTVSLLPNIMGKNQAVRAGAAEAWMLDEQGLVTEGTSSNAWIVTQKGELVTRYLDQAILAGITRRAIIGHAEKFQIPVVQRAFSLEEAKGAREAFFTSATAILRPVVKIDDAQVGDGQVGPIARRLADAYFDALDALGTAP
jgi:D-alanine transaminase